jgi:hypothetical protein
MLVEFMVVLAKVKLPPVRVVNVVFAVMLLVKKTPWTT